MYREGQTIVVKRQQLYEHVWTEPAAKIAKQYDISDLALAMIAPC